MSTRLRDVALVLLFVLTVGAAFYVVTRTPGGIPVAEGTPAPSPSATGQPRALFLGGDALLEPSPGLPQLVAQALGWRVQVAAEPGSGFVSGDPAALPARVEAAMFNAQADVVVLVASTAAAEEGDGLVLGGNVQFVVGAVRAALPEAEVVLVGPLTRAPDGAPLQRQVLTQVAARFGAFFVDVSGRGYLAAQPGLVEGESQLTPAGVQEAARGLAVELRRVLPALLLPTPAAA